MNLQVKGILQNLGDKTGCAETEFSYLAAKIRPDTNDEDIRQILLQAIQRLSSTREEFKSTEDVLKGVLVKL
ncbi:hypothetical protein [Acidaminococcus timonensis]|uniref:hypothetical protein n=1 Tax=Acidaminococcus timonensis TaxID=1871002 RepID=UPI0008D9F416|nr:hypothetical protein [Acidaminococcus timonensis]